MQLVWRDNRTESLPVILTLLIQKSHTQTPVLWQLFMEIKLLNEYRVFSWESNVAMEKQALCLCFSVVITLNRIKEERCILSEICPFLR